MDLKIQMRDGDALITRARANLVTLFLDDPVGDAPAVRGRRYRLRAGTGIPADRVRGRRGGRRLSDQAGQLGQGEADAGGRPADGAVGRARLCARDRRSRSRRRRQRFHPRALCRNRLPDDPASRPGKDVRTSGLCVAAVLPRTFPRCAGGKSEPVCTVRVHDRSGAPAPISARILPSANAGPISAAKSGPISRAVSITSGRRSFTAMSRRNLRRPQAWPHGRSLAKVANAA